MILTSTLKTRAHSEGSTRTKREREQTLKLE